MLIFSFSILSSLKGNNFCGSTSELRVEGVFWDVYNFLRKVLHVLTADLYRSCPSTINLSMWCSLNHSSLMLWMSLQRSVVITEVISQVREMQPCSASLRSIAKDGTRSFWVSVLLNCSTSSRVQLDGQVVYFLYMASEQ